MRSKYRDKVCVIAKVPVRSPIQKLTANSADVGISNKVTMSVNVDSFVNLLIELKNVCDISWSLKPINSLKNEKNCLESMSTLNKQEILKKQIKDFLMKCPENITDVEDTLIKALKLLDDIQSIKNYQTIRILGFILIKIIKSKLQGLYINELQINKMKLNFDKSSVIFVPNHRSYLDFILMAFICFHYDIEVPYVAAAMDFKNMKIMGNLLKQCGAFFLRRNKQVQDDIYHLTLFSYIKYLIVYEKKPLQFFIEGTRSRSNKSVIPKLGLLKFILDLILNDEIHDTIFVPISINYDRLLEDKLFSCELLGIPKGLIKSIKKLDKSYGNIYIHFSSPISARNFINTNKLNSIMNKNDILKTLAYEILYRQQRGIVLSYINILAVDLIFCLSKNYSNQIHLDTVIDNIFWINKLFEKCGATVEIKKSDITQRVTESIKLHLNYLVLEDNNLRIHTDGIQNFDLHDSLEFKYETFKSAFPMILNQLYINPTLHFIVNVAFITILIDSKMYWNNELLNLKAKFFLLRKLFEFEFAFIEFSEIEDFKISYSLYLCMNKKEKELLRLLISTPFLYCYQLIYDILGSVSTKDISAIYLYKLVYLRIEYLMNDNFQQCFNLYCLSKDFIINNLNSLIKLQMINKYKKPGNETTYYSINKKQSILDLTVLFGDLITSSKKNIEKLLMSKI
ncbi:dihydroxyacetone phosphate acyltransferase isoform X2 [Daktulosphaira vitifoliae]|uniref:dihydroxyacetone phosphate acyltransferase isoform X2 n=1 Tax=Daktulosphaira vitifoliae TaxID=58002 RepID=UPI0021A9BAB6|nr:dihydroxyacetone phosphate acyltransferase isoform X2 [Daktulosphaira vitifoliae]